MVLSVCLFVSRLKRLLLLALVLATWITCVPDVYSTVKKTLLSPAVKFMLAGAYS